MHITIRFPKYNPQLFVTNGLYPLNILIKIKIPPPQMFSSYICFDGIISVISIPYKYLYQTVIPTVLLRYFLLQVFRK